MSDRRKVPDAATAATWLRSVAESGLSLPEWCAREGVHGSSLHVWKRTLARWARNGAPAGLVGSLPAVATPAQKPALASLELVELLPVVAGPARKPAVTQLVAATSAIRVHVGDLVVEVNAGFDTEMLFGVVQTLRRC